MRIFVLPAPEGDVIAREEQFGRFEGEFFLRDHGHVFYRHPLDSRPWFAGSTPSAFNKAVPAWNRYCDQVTPNYTEEKQQEAVGRLRDALSQVGALITQTDNVWMSLLEQAQNGLL
jgi:hypothetical protein